MNSIYIASAHQAFLSKLGLDSFEAFWNLEIDWFEAPNERRGGWSGVGRIEVVNDENPSLILFVKKQQNHGRKTWRHPFVGEPTFRREFARLRFLEEHDFSAPKVVFYAEAIVQGSQRAILVTEALNGFVSLDNLSESWLKGATLKQQGRLIRRIAQEIRRFHDFGLVHRALYPKHIFVKNADTQPEIALIDLEKTRRTMFSRAAAIFDLAALHRHALRWRKSQRILFLIEYMQTKRLSKAAKRIAHAIIRRASR